MAAEGRVPLVDLAAEQLLEKHLLRRFSGICAASLGLGVRGVPLQESPPRSSSAVSSGVLDSSLFFLCRRCGPAYAWLGWTGNFFLYFLIILQKYTTVSKFYSVDNHNFTVLTTIRHGSE
jgi:hypothetical protein